MRNRVSFFCAALTAFLAVACAKAEPERSGEAEEIPSGGGGCYLDTLYSNLDGQVDTKITLDPNGETGQLCWEKDEEIKVLCSDGKTVIYKLIGGEGTKRGVFAGTPEKDAEPLYAVSSFSGNLTKDEGYLTFPLSQEISAAAAPAARSFTSVAQVSGSSVELKNIMGLLRVDFSGTASNIKKIVLHDLAGNDLCGTCRVPIKDDGSLDYENATVSGGGNTLSLNFAEGQNLAGNSYYFPIPVGALDGGFSIVLYEADDTKTDDVGRAYSFMQKISGTKPMPRSGLLFISAAVSEKSEPFSVKERGYYKSLFVNAGVSLDAFRHKDSERPKDDIPAIEYMGLDKDFEYINLSNKETQNGIIIGNDDDANGVLLYPDGSPRFRLVFNRGGNSISHGTSLGEEGRGRFKTFFDNGGSYSGVCAGAFLAANEVTTAEPEEDEDEDFTFQLIPVKLTHTSLPNGMSHYKGIYTNMAILSNAQSIISSLNEDDGKFSALTGTSIADVMHHGGGYLPSEQLPISGVEALMTYQFSTTHGSTTEPFPGDTDPAATYDDHYYRSDNYKKLDIYGYGTDRVGYYSTWAYKNPDPAKVHSGRAVCTGSHPEVPGSESDKQFTGFMFRYAMEGNGEAVVKTPDLTVGGTRYMDQLPSDYKNPAINDAGIGDGQYHHFKFTSAGIDNFVLRLDSQYDKNSGIDLYLGLRTDDKAWLSEADYTLCNKGGQKELRIKHLPAGTWYVSVFCATKVTAKQGTSYCTYSGKTQVLNGVPYSITILADGYVGDYTPKPFGGNGDDFTDSMDD